MHSKLTRAVIVFVLLVLMAALAGPALASPRSIPPLPTDITSARQGGEVYIVMMAQDPVVAYEGGIRGYAATRPGNGHINPRSAAVTKYVGYLNNKHANVLKAVGADPSTAKVYDYVYSFNGFAAVLTPDQLARLDAQPDVIMVWEDEMLQPATDYTPEFLGLTAEGSLWDQGYLGEDVIIGIVDTGIWPEHPSFSDQADLADRPGESGKRDRVYDDPTGWFGTCQSGELWSQDDCNNKLIGARYFMNGYRHQDIFIDEYASARDADGHGTHTSSTAGGNANVPASIMGGDLGTVSGMAPRARIAAYKVCWNGDSGGCPFSDSTAAIDLAVADGVDVINFSIGGSTSYIYGPVDIAFFFAQRNNVFVASSAGNEGPGPYTVAHPGPWQTTVAASTQPRMFEGSVTTGDALAYYGASVTGSTDVLPIVDSANAAAPGADPAEAELCYVGSLDPAVVAGKIVLCKRGVIARVDKSLAVMLAGGSGMVLYNPNDAQALVTDNHWVPSVHINFTDGSAIKAYIAGTGAPTAQIIGGTKQTDFDAPYMADFSSRGPILASGDLIKPDVTAPGVNILAGNSPSAFLGAEGQFFQSISGTSMSSPHVAGLAALLIDAHPEWYNYEIDLDPGAAVVPYANWMPSIVKSALMTTAYQDVEKEDRVTPADPFDFGAGHVAPNPASDPGLVYPNGLWDNVAFMCGWGPYWNAPTCARGDIRSLNHSRDASDTNLASIAIGELAGSQTVKRTVLNIGPAGTYTASVEAPLGVDVTVSPATLTLASGEWASFEVTFTTTEAALYDEYAFGALTWSDGAHNVRSPLAIRPVRLAAPDEVHGLPGETSLTYEVMFGYAGDFNAQAYGLTPAYIETSTVVDDPTNDINSALGSGVGVNFHVYTLTGVAYQRWSLFDDYVDGATDDLDLYVFYCDDVSCTQVGVSGSATSTEAVSLAYPADGTYIVVVHGWQTDGPDAVYDLFSWSVPPVDAGNMTVTAPTAATLGTLGSITLDWTGLGSGKWLGLVAYDDGANALGHTVVAVDVP